MKKSFYRAHRDGRADRARVAARSRKKRACPPCNVRFGPRGRPSRLSTPRLAQEHLLRQAQFNKAATFILARPPPDKAISLGSHPSLGFPVELNVSDMGHTLILGPTKSGKNNCAYQIGKGGLALGRRFEVIGQKGDELKRLTSGLARFICLSNATRGTTEPYWPRSSRLLDGGSRSLCHSESHCPANSAGVSAHLAADVGQRSGCRVGQYGARF